MPARFDTMQIISVATILLLLAAVSNAVKIFRLGNASAPVTKIRPEDFGATNAEGEHVPYECAFSFLAAAYGRHSEPIYCTEVASPVSPLGKLSQAEGKRTSGGWSSSFTLSIFVNPELTTHQH